MISPHRGAADVVLRALLQPMTTELVEERGALEPQHPGGFAFVASGAKESPFEHTALDLEVGAA
jgi:hypothetical protein